MNSGIDHESNATISEAALWYAANRHQCEQPIVPALRRRFDLTPKEACQALTEANRIGGANATS